ncbi:efflux RND transporter periplasmic adaptor subunit [Aureimonas leprariae]|uniref:Efflux RND transporter periplasmic adaptor subunit n=2 Tax=Plantimonas leprariae TaxID=2615207 RepID=A0A7V7PLI9_9HYPH|nr:efflux RND transporter periplasmic adaptor subunit [Aureimonas leprariae]
MAWRNRAFLMAEMGGGGAKPEAEAQAAPAPGGGGAPPAMPVPVAKVVKRTLPTWLDYSARTEAIRSVSLQTKVTGFVASQPMADGADVKGGDLLYKLDPRDFEAALEQARAAVQRDEAALTYARAAEQRSSSLVRTGSTAKDALDQNTSARAQAEAAVALDRATVKTAELNLGYAEVRAPFAGRLGRDRAPVGTLVGANTTTLNTLVQLDPVYVTFNPSERDLAAIAKAKRKSEVKVEVTLPGTDGETHRGDLTFIDNAVDPQTGTITARATIPNADFALLPGQYVRARLVVAEQPDVLMVPQAAVGSGQLGKYVYVIGDTGTAEQRLVTLGPTEGDLVAAAGIKESDRVITGNLQKIGPGAPVQPLPTETAAK